MSSQWADLCRANVEAVATLAADLSNEQLSARVPATLDWDVHDLLSHMAGGAADRPAIVWDLVVHHADLHEALGLGAMPEPLWAPVLEAVARMRLGADAERVRSAAPDYELFRALFSRRSRGQLAGWDVPGYDEQGLSELGIFGPREDDQPVPT